jgi:3-deoxy-D-manno-octulosonate 8-phosphate phosphatase (KDO 8-P phosphatase)
MVYMGDDVVDLPLMKLVGVSACPVDASPEVLSRVDLVIDSPGGRGAAGKLIERILDAQGKWQELMRKYLNNND